MTSSRPRRLRARAEVAWAFTAFLFLQIGYLAAIDVVQPGWWDAENEYRLRLITEQRQRGPEHPLLVVLGSSRIGAGFMPAQLPTLRTADGRTATPFNYSHLAAGPRMNTMLLERLLIDGITPEWVVMEIVPGSLVHERAPAEFAAARDVPGLCRNAPWTQVLPVYCRGRLNPFYKHRQTALGHMAPPLVTRVDHRDEITLLPLGDDDHWFRRTGPNEDRARLIAQARDIYYDRLQDFHIDPQLGGAVSESLDQCRDHGISAIVLLTPENSDYRSWYSAETEQRLQAFLGKLTSRYGVRLIDARAWVSDDGFDDAHHLSLKGAQVFTERLGREVLQPLVGGRDARSLAVRAATVRERALDTAP